MSRPTSASILVLFGLGAALAAGTAWLVVSWRFDAGDLHPAYSTHRADPMGAAALYESLARLPGLTVTRNERDLETADLPPGAALVLLGVDPEWRLAGRLAALEAFVRQGGCLVLALRPLQDDGRLVVDRLETQRRGPRRGASRPSKGWPGGLLVESEPDVDQLLERLGVELGYAALPRDELAERAMAVVAVSGNGPVPRQRVAWYSALTFSLPDDVTDWQTVLRRGEAPVVIARPVGQGRVVLATDSYWLSNEGLRRERPAALLAWLVGPHRRIVFDESHLGVVQTPSAGDLARQYGLTWPLAGLVLIGLLFVWRSMSRLVPPPVDWAAGLRREAAQGKTAGEGFVHLLRVNITPGRLLPVCLAEWVRTVGRERPPSAEVQAVLDRLRDDEDVAHDHRLLVEAYRRICLYLDPRLARRPARSSPRKE